MLERLKESYSAKNLFKTSNPINKNITYVKPTPYEFSKLSLDAYYYDNDPLRMPPDWFQLYSQQITNPSEPRHGFFGKCYVKIDSIGNPISLVFGFRGTYIADTDGIENVIDDINFGLDKSLNSFPAAMKFLEDGWEAFRKKYPNVDAIDFVHSTGHSLGSMLADLVGLLMTSNCTFENPGTYQLVLSFLKSQGFDEEEIKSILNRVSTNPVFQADVNVINSFKKPLGQQFRLANPVYEYAFTLVPNRISPIYFKNVSYLMYSYDQHRMEKIVNYLENNGETELFAPVFGLQNAYVIYLNPTQRKRYWDGYFAYIWEKNPVMKIKFKDDYDKYIDWCYIILTDVYNEASKTSTLVLVTNNNQTLFYNSNSSKHEFVLIEDEGVNNALGCTNNIGKNCSVM